MGLGPDDPAVNPLAAAELPTFRRLLDGARPVARAAPLRAGRATLFPVDALLGVAGTPQSGTGHAALLTGRNAPREFGRHYGPWVPTALRSVVAEEGILTRAVAAGRRVAFANAYPEELARLAEAGVQGRRLGPLRAGPPLAAMGAGLLDRHTPELERGEAVASEILNTGWRERLGRATLPVIGPERAGENLSRIAAANDLTLFAHYSTDTVGHRGGFDDAIAALALVDAFLDGVARSLPPDMLLLVLSDHGNIEDVRRQHTENAALGLAVGPGHSTVAAEIRALTDIMPAVLRWTGV